jgi:hypothetical protein
MTRAFTAVTPEFAQPTRKMRKEETETFLVSLRNKEKKVETIALGLYLVFNHRILKSSNSKSPRLVSEHIEQDVESCEG